MDMATGNSEVSNMNGEGKMLFSRCSCHAMPQAVVRTTNINYVHTLRLKYDGLPGTMVRQINIHEVHVLQNE